MNKAIKQVCIEETIFYPKVKANLKSAQPKQYALVSLDFDNFNFVNDMFGFIVGDKILSALEMQFAHNMREGEFFTRAHADHFIFFINVNLDELIIDRFNEIANFGNALCKVLPEHYTLVCSGGIVIIDDPCERLTSLLDKANFSRKKAKGNHHNTFLYYDKEVSEELSWKKKITLWMHSALNNKEFEMYLQPKIDIKTGEIVGAEALARWNSPALGMIMPANFIPVFEQNGFVKLLDFFILEKACMFLKQCQNEGRKIVPVSVNFSKLHVRTSDFAKHIFEVAHSHGVPAEFIEIEFTESAFSIDCRNLIDAAEQLMQMGFSVSLDDFGSGYSTLNNLKDIPVNIIKIDRGFLAQSSVSEKGIVILSKIVELTKAINIKTVIEGVETPEHLEIAKSVGCDIAQGFYYSMPLEADKFVELIINNCAYITHKTQIVAPVDYKAKLSQDADKWDILNITNEMDVAVLKTYLDKTSSIQFINNKALEIMEYTKSELREIHNNNFARILNSNSYVVLVEIASQLIKHKKPLTYTVELITKNGLPLKVSGRVSYTEDKSGRPMGVFVYSNAKNSLNKLQSEKIAELKLELKASNQNNKALQDECLKYSITQLLSDDINYDWDFEKDYIKFSDNFEQMFQRPPITNNISTNPELIDRIHPDDIEVFEKWRKDTLSGKDINNLEYRLQSANGDSVWLRVRSTVIRDDNGKPLRAVGLFTNISNIKSELDFLREKSQLDPLTLIYNKAELTRRVINFVSANTNSALFIIDVDNFKGVNDSLGHQFGDNVLKLIAEKLKATFSENCIVGRLGGDEFTVLYYGDCSKENISKLSQNLMNGLRKTYYGENIMYSISCSVGIALSPQHGTTYTELYHFADVALYTAKRMGKDCCQLYDDKMLNQSNTALTPLDTKNLFLNDYFQGDPIYNVFEMLYETKEISTTIEQILEFLGKHFQVDRVYIFQHSDNGQTTSNTFEWCADGITPEKEKLQNIPIEVISVFLTLFNSEGLNICNDINSLCESDYKELNSQGIKSLLQCELHIDGKATGFIGFDDCHSPREWRGEMVASIGYVSRILSVFMSKNRISRDLIESQSNYENMIYSLNGYVYVIDCESYELLYINKNLEALKIKVGQKCHDAAFGSDSPCQNCPARQLSAFKTYANCDIFSVKLGVWVNSAASVLQWTDKKKLALINCTEIDKRF